MCSISAIELARKFLRVDMTTGKITTELLDEGMMREYLGGSCLGARLIYDEVKPGVKPLDPENRVIITTGIMTGTNAPGTSLFNVTTKGTLTNLAASSQANGFFGVRLKQAGFGGIIIQGKSPIWKYLLIENGHAELRDAQQLLGKTTFETEALLKETIDSKKVSVACIGPAGENLVKFAAIEADGGHFASTNGTGCVMGSKKLKAIVAYGDYKVEPAHPEQFKEVVKACVNSCVSSPMGTGISALGTSMIHTPYYKLGALPIKNLSSHEFLQYEIFDGTAIKQNPAFEFKKEPCYACPLGHCKEVTIKEGVHAGKKVEEPEYEGYAAFGCNLGITDVVESVMLSTLNDELGMDLKECTFTLSWAMECYEKGYITKTDTGGLELTWGNVEVVRKLLPMIANREGFGDLLAEGVMRASNKYGGEAAKCAVYCRNGIAPHVHDPRALWSLNFTQAVSDSGSIIGSVPDLGPNPELGYPMPIPPRESEEHPIALSRVVRKNQFNDSLMTCSFCYTSMPELAACLNALTGWDMPVEEAFSIGEKTVTLLRSFNIRHGATPENDTLSTRLLDAPLDGPVAGDTIRPVLEKMKFKYYGAMGWDE